MEIEKHNAEAIRMTLADMDRRIRDQQIQLNALTQTIASLQATVVEQETQLRLLRAKVAGHGPTR